MQTDRTNGKEAESKSVPWRDNSSFVATYYSILTAMVGAILALAIGDQEIKDSWYLPVGLLSASMIFFILGLEKCLDAIDEDDIDKYLAWLLAYNLGTVAMFFGIATYIVLRYRPTWEIFIVIQVLTIIASSKWLCDLWYLLFKGEAEYESYRQELLGDRQPEKDPDWLMHLLRFSRQLRSRKGKK